ncbi:UNVERIFIED_CONTAM: hypothetical protein Slati_4401000 [Sesamum latifolium]|uniref:Uncharacterized protein n=1 Tax=Sesamum latifolium TaxID=2727402 RepID=A0AAW2SPJ1_9LAMI
MVESAVVACLELFQATTPPLSLNTKPDWDLAFVIVRLEASIAVAFQYQFTTIVDQEHIFSPFQVLKYGLNRAPVRLPGACLISAHHA